MTIVLAPPNVQPHIDRLWAFLSVDDEGNEGVCAATLGKIVMPLIASDKVRLSQLTPIAEEIARLTGRTIRLVEFTTRREVTEITGQRHG